MGAAVSAGLLRKELREQRPFVLLVVFLVLLDLSDWMRKQFDMLPLGMTFEDLGAELAPLLFFVAFAMGTGLLIREIDDRTLTFLDGLPVSRLRVFFVKVAVAGGVLLAYPLACVVMRAAQHLMARQSLDHALHAPLLGQALAMLCLVTGVGLALGLLLGFLRSLSWLTLALGAILLHLLTRLAPSLSTLNPILLLDARGGASMQVPVAVAIQLGILLVCAASALAIFLRTGERPGRLQARLTRPLVSATVTLATIALVFTLFVLYVRPDVPPPPGPGEPQVAGATFAVAPPGNALTEHYSFSYPARQATDMQAMLMGADRIHAQVAELLDTQAGPRIDVDLSGSAINTLGAATHDRIRMRQGANALAVLAHETTHVLAQRLAGGERERELSKMNVFSEGLAEWVENQISTGSGLTDDERLQAAIISRRQLLRVEHLTDFNALERVADRGLQYPLGAVLVDSMVARYGRDAPGKLLRTLGDPDFPRGLQTAELWFAAFQQTGYDLALVFADYVRRAKAWETRYASQISALPRPRGSLVRNGNLIGVELRIDGPLPEDAVAVVRFRPKDDSELRLYTQQNADSSLVAWTRMHLVVDEQVCFQPGVRRDQVTFYETWVCLPVESAGRL